MINTQEIITNLQLDSNRLTEDLIIILGPTASGKTKLAVQLAKAMNAEIISVDSRQVYRGMDIGTGKDLSEYGDINYHLIDIIEPGDKYNVSRFLNDFEDAYLDIRAKGKNVIACGGTGFYLQSLLESRPYTQIPVNQNLRIELGSLEKEDLLKLLDSLMIPSNFSMDRSSKKRIIRAIEILDFLKNNPDFKFEDFKSYSAKVIGLNPPVEIRRSRISHRLKLRIEEGLISEVEKLIDFGVSYEDLEYYGLEYKYISYYLKGLLSYEEFYAKLETEIHRYAKRQMTFFRKMEKDGVVISWI